ncbi:MAG: hypothetical protein OXE56_05875 [Gammaproteobacteria bacterium]|nr:hypothetical protein [Gammaproteobacteria bacterium]
MKLTQTIKGTIIALATVIGLCATLVIGINLWIPKQPIINYINSSTGGTSSFDDVVIGWDWGPDIRIDGLIIREIQLGDSLAEIKFAQTRLKISFEALWRGLTEEEIISNLNVENTTDKLSSTGIGNWLAQYFQSLKIIDGTIITSRGSSKSEFSADLFEVRAFDEESTVVIYQGSVDGVNLMLTGALAGIRTLLKDNSSKLVVEGFIVDQANTVYAEGMIGDIRTLSDISLTARLAVKDPSSLIAKLDSPTLDLDMFSGFNLQFDISTPDTLDLLAITSLKLQTSAYGVDIRLLSAPDQPVNLEQLDLEFEAVGTILESTIPDRPKLGNNLNLNINGRINGSPDQIVFTPNEVLIEGQGFSASLDGRFSWVDGNWSSEAILEAEIAKDAEFIGSAFQFLLPATAKSNLYIESRGLIFNDIYIKTNQEVAKQAEVVANGELIASDLGLNGNFMITGLFDREGLLQLRKTRLPEEIQLEARTILRVNNSKLSLDPIDLVGHLPGIRLQGEATYSLDEGPDNMVIQIRGEADSAKSIGKVFKKSWPDTSRVLVSSVLRKPIGKSWLLDDFHVEMIEESLEIVADGSMQVFGVGDIGMFEINAMAQHSQFMERISKSAFLQSLVSPIVPLKGTAMLHVKRNSKGWLLFDLREIDIQNEVSREFVSATGHIDNLQSLKRKGVLSIRVRDNQGGYSSLLDVKHVEKHPILSELMQADLDLVFDGRRMYIDNLSINLVTKVARITATGSFESLNPLMTRDFNIDFKVQELSQLNRFAKSSRFQKLPAEGRIKVTNSSGEAFDLDFNAKIAEQDFNGEFQVGFSPFDKPEIKGYLQTNDFNMEKLFEKRKKEGPFFSESKFDLSWLDSFNLDLELKIGRYRDVVFVLDDFFGDIKIKDGSLEATMVGHAKDKPVEMQFLLLPSELGWKTDMNMKAINVDVDALDHNFRGTADLESVFSIDLDLTSEGRSMSEMASKTNGDFTLEVSDVGVRVGDSFVFGDLIFGMFNFILSLQSQQDFDLMECGVASFQVKDGIARLKNSLALKLKDFTILGSGQLDLASEKVDIVFSSKARKGLGISFNTVAKLFKIGGTLRNPELVADTEGLAKTGASIFAGFLTGGLSTLAQGLFDRTIANSDVCEVARSSNAS